MSHQLFFTRATAPKGAIELEAAEHLDAFPKVYGQSGFVSLQAWKKKKKKETNEGGRSSQSCAGLVHPCADSTSPRHCSVK